MPNHALARITNCILSTRTKSHIVVSRHLQQGVLSRPCGHDKGVRIDLALRALLPLLLPLHPAKQEWVVVDKPKGSSPNAAPE